MRFSGWLEQYQRGKPKGEAQKEFAGEEETELIAEFDSAEMEQYRKQIDILGDRRPDIYGTP